ncbi:MAG: cache domain-containing protein [Proteobacteria bacterium]|nr:cache domain-containing protein [Pseudomonadota bacterium]
MSPRKFWLRSGLALALAMAGVAWGLSHWYLSSYTREVGDRLELLVELRKGAVAEYFSTAQAELQFWSTNPDILAAQAGFNAVWAGAEPALLSGQIRDSYVEKNPYQGSLFQLDDAQDGSMYSALHSQIHPLAKLFVSERGYYDVFLIGSDGDVFYTVEKESDFGSNLSTGQWRDSGLARAYKRALQSRAGAVYISDMQPYGPSDNAPAMFIARALRDASGEAMGVIAFQLPTAKILEIMAYMEGMGETGETYLVGQDKLMRSNSRFSEQVSVLTQTVDTLAVTRALEGESGVGFITDYRGMEVMSAYTSLAVGRSVWAVVAEFDRQEIIDSAAAERPSLSGALAFIYGLSLWSLWYWRGRRLDGAAGGDTDIADIELDVGDFGDSSGMGA